MMFGALDVHCSSPPQPRDVKTKPSNPGVCVCDTVYMIEGESV